MKSKDNYKEYADQSKQSDKEIAEALERIISKAKRENDALYKVLKKITNQYAAGN